MTSEDDRYWNEIVGPLRRAEGFCVPNPDELQAELDAIDAEPLTDEQIDAMVNAATFGIFNSWIPRPNFDWTEDRISNSIREDTLRLNRNLGDADAEVDKLLDRQRREALENDEGIPREQKRMDDGGEKPGDGD